MSTFAEIITNPALFGMHLFPLTAGSKVPLKGTNGQDDATDNPATLARWAEQYPTANAGIHCAPSGLYVVDVDCGGTKVGGASWDALVLEHGHVETFTVRTPSGGLHFYYAMPPGDALTNTANKLGQHIDTRGNGYVVAPGSIVNGTAYEVVTDAPIAELPEWIVEAVRKPKRIAGQAPLMPYTLADPTDVERRVIALAEELASAPDGKGNHTAARVAFMVGGYVGAGQISAHIAGAILEGALAGWTFRDRASERAMYSTIERQIAEGAKTPRPWTAARFPVDALEFPPAADYATTEVPVAAEVTETGSLLDEKPKPPPSDWGTDAGQARWIVGESDDLIHVKGVGWLKWDGARWAPISDEQVGKAIVAFYKREFGKAVAKWQADPEDAAARSRCGFLAKHQGTSRVKAVLTALKWVTSLDGAEPAMLLDSHHHLLNTPAGVVDLRTGQISAHDKALLLTKITRGNYVAGFTHDDWTVRVAGCLPGEVWNYMQLRMGAALVSDSHPDTMLFLFGARGRNGKSSITDDGVLPALGDYGHMAPAHILSGGKGKDGDLSPDKAALLGRRFVLIEELEEGASFSSNEAKRLIGTGSLSARTLHEKPMTFNASHTLFATTNHEPNVPETTEAAWRRLLMIRFEKEYVLEPTEPHQLPADPMLKHRLRSNTDGQHDAIVTWLVQGAMRYYTDPTSILKDREPAIVTGWTSEWRAKADRVFAYATERLVFDPEGMVATTDLFEDVNEWLVAGNYSKWSRKTFLDRMLGHAQFDGRVRRSQVRNLDGLSRPARDFPATLGTRPEVLHGIRFTTDLDAECSCPNARWGEHATTCKDAA